MPLQFALSWTSLPVEGGYGPMVEIVKKRPSDNALKKHSMLENGVIRNGLGANGFIENGLIQKGFTQNDLVQSGH
ncbi:hypothetical protein MRX96_027199 [Rhipicephalus microplus]